MLLKALLVLTDDEICVRFGRDGDLKVIKLVVKLGKLVEVCGCRFNSDVVIHRLIYRGD